MHYWFSPGSIIVTILVLQVACLLISPSVLVYLYCREINGKHKQAKGNDCSQYKSAAAIFSSILPICPINIFSSDTQACFALVFSHSMPSNMLHTRLYP
jgi:hypothetical protein